MNRRAAISAAAIASAAAVLTLGAAPGAVAAAPRTVHPMSCPMDKGVSISGLKTVFVPDKNKRVYGSSGVTLSISVAKGTSWTGSVTGSAGSELNLIIAKVNVTGGGGYTWGKTTTVTLGGTWKVPSSQKTGWLAMGSKGGHANWVVSQTQPKCNEKVLAKGTIDLPKLSPYIAHS